MISPELLRQNLIKAYRVEYRHQVHKLKPWRDDKVAESFRKCGLVAVEAVIERCDDLEDARRMLLDYINETGLGLDQQLTLEGQLRDIA